jgi:hypothetical protein
MMSYAAAGNDTLVLAPSSVFRTLCSRSAADDLPRIQVGAALALLVLWVSECPDRTR